MPIHPDWRDLYHSFIEQYGEEKGKSVFYAYCEKHNIDYTKAKPKKENFSWVGDIKPVLGVTNLIRGEALHPLKTVHPEEWPSVRVYLEEELQKAARTLANKPLLLDHSTLIDGEVTGAQYEDGAIEYVAQVNDSRILGLIKDGAIKHCSVEFEWKSLEHVNGVAPKGINFTGLSLLKNFAPGDPLSTVELVEVWEGIVKKLKEAKMKEQAEPQEFILYMLHDPMTFLPEHFSTAWIDQTNGIQGIFGRLREDPENSVPQALLFMKATGWTLEKMQDWLQNHPQYLLASAPAQSGIQPASGDTGVIKMSKEKRPQTLEGRVTFLETSKRLKEQELSKDEIEAKINELTQKRQALDAELQQIAEEEQPKRDEIWQQIDLINAELQAYEQALAALIAGTAVPSGGGSTEEGKLKEQGNNENGEQEKLRQAQKERAEKYGISPKEGGHLTKPSEYEDVAEDQFADPVNYRYPVTEKYVKGAVTYFNQPDNREAGSYTHEEAVKIMTTIINAALNAGIEVSWQPEDPVYRDLPEELKKKLTGYEEPSQTAIKQQGNQEPTKGLGEAIIAPSDTPPKPSALINKQEILALIPDRRVWRSWSYGPQMLVKQLKHKLEAE